VAFVLTAPGSRHHLLLLRLHASRLILVGVLRVGQQGISTAHRAILSKQHYPNMQHKGS
jgi:hypothetical protein